MAVDVDVDSSAACAASVLCVVGGIVGVSGALKEDAVGSRGVCTVFDALFPVIVSDVEFVTTCGDRESEFACAGA